MGDCLLTPPAACVYEAVAFCKYLKAKLNFGIVAYNSDWRERQVVSNPASYKAGASAWGVGSSEGTSEMGGTSGCS